MTSTFDEIVANGPGGGCELNVIRNVRLRTPGNKDRHNRHVMLGRCGADVVQWEI